MPRLGAPAQIVRGQQCDRGPRTCVRVDRHQSSMKSGPEFWPRGRCPSSRCDSPDRIGASTARIEERKTTHPPNPNRERLLSRQTAAGRTSGRPRRAPILLSYTTGRTQGRTSHKICRTIRHLVAPSPNLAKTTPGVAEASPAFSGRNPDLAEAARNHIKVVRSRAGSPETGLPLSSKSRPKMVETISTAAESSELGLTEPNSGQHVPDVGRIERAKLVESTPFVFVEPSSISNLASADVVDPAPCFVSKLTRQHPLHANPIEEGRRHDKGHDIHLPPTGDYPRWPLAATTPRIRKAHRNERRHASKLDRRTAKRVPQDQFLQPSGKLAEPQRNSVGNVTNQGVCDPNHRRCSRHPRRNEQRRSSIAPPQCSIEFTCKLWRNTTESEATHLTPPSISTSRWCALKFQPCHVKWRRLQRGERRRSAGRWALCPQIAARCEMAGPPCKGFDKTWSCRHGTPGWVSLWHILASPAPTHRVCCRNSGSTASKHAGNSNIMECPSLFQAGGSVGRWSRPQDTGRATSTLDRTSLELDPHKYPT